MPDKLPPHDIDAEEAVNGSLLIDGTAIFDVATTLHGQDFYSEPNRLIFQSCFSLYERSEAINQITVAEELERQGKLESIGGAAYLSNLISKVPTSLDIKHYAHIIYRLSVMRQLINAANEVSRIGYQADPDVNTALSRAEEIIFKIREVRGNIELVHIKEMLDKYFEAGAPGDEHEQLQSIMSGYTGLDQFLEGFQRSDLIIVAGRPSMGKTSFALNIARNAAVEHKACVALFSLEMARESVVVRLLSSESGVNLRRLRFSQQIHTENEERKLMDATGILSEAPIYIDDSPLLRVMEMRSKVRALHFERGVDLVIVDYLQLLQGEGKDEVEKIGYISRQLKALARELSVPVIAVSQLSRAVESRLTHRPQLSDLRGSGSIEQDADVVMFIYRDDYYFKREEWEAQFPDKEYPEGIAEVIIAKHRNGPTGDVKLRFIPASAKFEDLASQQQMGVS
jgi:replicative DNA helicase